MPQGNYVLEDYLVSEPCGWAKNVTSTSYEYTLVGSQAKTYITESAVQADINILTSAPHNLPSARFGVGRKP